CKARPTDRKRYGASTLRKPTESSDRWAYRRCWHDALHSNEIVNTISVGIINHLSNSVKLLRSYLKPPRRIHPDLLSAEDSLTSEVVNLVNREAEFFSDHLGGESAVAAPPRELRGRGVGASRGDFVTVADPLDHAGMELLPSSAQEVEAVELLSDFPIWQDLCFLAHEVDDGWRCLNGLIRRSWMVDGELGGSACFPVDLDTNGGIFF